MMAEDEKLTGVLHCEGCGNDGLMSIKAEYIKTDIVENEDEGHRYQDYDGESIYHIVVCPVCDEVMFVRAWAWHERVKPFVTLYPPTVEYSKDIPDEIVVAMKDAASVRQRSPNAYGVMAGRAIEKICRHMGCSGDRLVDNINELVRMGKVPDMLGSMAHKIRHFRNRGAHGGEGDLTSEEASVIEAILRVIVEYIYSGPALLDTAGRLASKLP